MKIERPLPNNFYFIFILIISRIISNAVKLDDEILAEIINKIGLTSEQIEQYIELENEE